MQADRISAAPSTEGGFHVHLNVYAWPQACHVCLSLGGPGSCSFVMAALLHGISSWNVFDKPNLIRVDLRLRARTRMEEALVSRNADAHVDTTASGFVFQVVGGPSWRIAFFCVGGFWARRMTLETDFSENTRNNLKSKIPKLGALKSPKNQNEGISQLSRMFEAADRQAQIVTERNRQGQTGTNRDRETDGTHRLRDSGARARRSGSPSLAPKPKRKKKKKQKKKKQKKKNQKKKKRRRKEEEEEEEENDSNKIYRSLDTP